MPKAAKPQAKRMGRPPLENARILPLKTKVSARELRDCELAAQREGKTLSEWARNALLLRASASG